MAQKKWSPPPLPKSVVPKEAFDVGEPAMCGVIEFAAGDIEITSQHPSTMRTTRPCSGANTDVAPCWSRLRNRLTAAPPMKQEASYGARSL